MSAPINLLGQVFERLTVIEQLPSSKDGKTRWRCRCECGNETEVYGKYLRTGKTKSCGCFRKDYLSKNPRIKHGHTANGGNTRSSRTYSSWSSMIQRTENPNHKQFYLYGGRGIKICDRWRSSFQNFLDDMGECPEGKSIDRINNDLGYFPENCRWATASEQNKNRRTWIRRKIMST